MNIAISKLAAYHFVVKNSFSIDYKIKKVRPEEGSSSEHWPRAPRIERIRVLLNFTPGAKLSFACVVFCSREL